MYISDVTFYLMVFPVLAFMVHASATCFRSSLQRWQLLLMTLVILSPLSLHLIAWDFSRIWMYPIFHALLAVWVCTELYMPEPQHRSVLVIVLFAGTLLVHALSQVPLMDGLVDGLSPERALYLMVPLSLFALGSVRQWLVSPFRLRD